MKKTYLILSVLVFSLMTAGFSYAYWSDTLTVTGTAETGSMKVVWKQGKGVTEYPGDPGTHVGAGGDYGDTFYDEVDAYFDSTDPQLLHIEFDNLFPGSKSRGGAWYENIGTIPAKLSNVKITLTTDNTDVGMTESEFQEFLSHIQVGVRSHDYNKNEQYPNLYPIGDRAWMDLLNVIDNEGYYFGDNELGDVAEKSVRIVGDGYDPFNKLMVVIWVDTALETAQDVEIGFTIELLFDQWNKPIPSETS